MLIALRGSKAKPAATTARKLSEAMAEALATLGGPLLAAAEVLNLVTD